MPNTKRAVALDAMPDSQELLAARAAGLSLVAYRAKKADALPPDEGDEDRLEKAEQQECWKVFRAFGGIVYSLSQSRASKQTPGLGDGFVIFPELMSFWWETKRQTGGRISTAQQIFHDACNRVQFDLSPIADALDCMAVEHVTHAEFYQRHAEYSRAAYARANGEDLRRFASELRMFGAASGSRHYIGGRREAEDLVVALGLAYRDEASGVLEPTRSPA